MHEGRVRLNVYPRHAGERHGVCEPPAPIKRRHSAPISSKLPPAAMKSALRDVELLLSGAESGYNSPPAARAATYREGTCQAKIGGNGSQPLFTQTA